jgi:hypothetical protein
MKWNRLAKSVVLGLAVLLATSAFASNKGSLNLQEDALVNGQRIPAGNYQLRWEGTGPEVELSFVQGKKVVAKTPAKVVERAQAANYDSAIVDRSGQNPSVTEVRFGGKKYALQIGGAAERAEMGGNSKSSNQK